MKLLHLLTVIALNFCVVLSSFYARLITLVHNSNMRYMKIHEKSPFRFVVIVVAIGMQLGLYSLSNAQQVEKKPYQEQLTLIEVKLRNGEFQEAFQIMDEVTAKYPNADEIYYAKGLLYGQFRNYEEAVANVQKALSIKKDLRYYNFLVDLYKSKQDLPAALSLLDEVIVHNPDIPQPYREKIMLLQVSKKPDEALAYYEVAKNKFGVSDTLDMLKAEILMNEGRTEEAKVLLKNWEEKSSPLRQVYSSLSYIYIQGKEPKKAVSTLEKGVEVTKDDLLYLDMADAYTASKNQKLAFNYLKKAFESDKLDFQEKNRVVHALLLRENGFTLDQLQDLTNVLVLKHPRMAESHMAKGDVMWRRKDPHAARSLFSVAVGINPANIDAWRMLINADMALQEVDVAIVHGLEGLRSNPNNSTLLYFTGLAYLMNDDKEKARQMLEMALNSSENENPFVQSNIYAALGDLYHQLKMESASDVAYEEAIKLDSTNVTAMNNLAYYLSLRKKDLEKAAEYSKRSNELDPNSATFQDTYAWVLFQQEKYEDALVWIEKSIKNSGTQISATLLDHYGDILYHVGKQREAIKQWEKASLLTDVEDVNREKLSLKIKNKKYVE